MKINKRGFIRMALTAAAGLMGRQVAAQDTKKKAEIEFRFGANETLSLASISPTQSLRLTLADKGEAGLGTIRLEYKGNTVEIKADELWRAVDPMWRPANNECPTCGTMAAPYDLERGIWIDAASSVVVPYLVRCKNCNTAFYQDEEK